MKKLLKVLLILLIIAIGAGVLFALKTMRSEPERKPPPDPSAVVQVIRAESASEPVTIRVMGTVIPARRVELFPEVSGRIVAQSKNLVPGGRLKKGERIVRIDPRDYNLALAQQAAAVTKARMDLATEKARKAVAEREWALIADEVQPTEDGKKLALREIQLETAEAALKSAKSSLGRARLSRNRTTLKAPFNALVVEEYVDKGQLVGPGTRIASIVDADVFWVRVSVPVDRLPWIELPDAKGRGGAGARIVQRVATDSEVVREGRVIKLLGDLEPQGKMARLLVEVEEPLVPNTVGNAAQLPLLLGAYVNVDIEGPELTDVVALPRATVRDNDRVWIKQDRKLVIREVEVVWSTAERSFVRGELTTKDDVVSSRIAAPVAGMPIRLNSEASDAGVEQVAGPAAADSKPTATTGGQSSGGGKAGAAQ